MNPKLKLHVDMSRVRQPNRSPTNNRQVLGNEQKEEGQMEMLHLHSEAIVLSTPSSGEPDSFLEEGQQDSVGDELQLLPGEQR